MFVYVCDTAIIQLYSVSLCGMSFGEYVQSVALDVEHPSREVATVQETHATNTAKEKTVFRQTTEMD